MLKRFFILELVSIRNSPGENISHVFVVRLVERFTADGFTSDKQQIDVLRANFLARR